MTNLLGRPVFLSVVSAMMAAMTAPTKPTPMTTTTSLPSARAASARASIRRSSSAYWSGLGSSNVSPVGLADCWLMLVSLSLSLWFGGRVVRAG
jgi:hypothetical protein